MAYCTNVLSNDLINQEVKRKKEMQLLRKQRQPKTLAHPREMARLMSLLMSCGQSKEKIVPRITAFAILGPLRESKCNV